MSTEELQNIQHLVEVAQDTLAEALACLLRGASPSHELRIAAGCISTAYRISEADPPGDEDASPQG